MDELAAFVRARLDEDEAAAKAAAGVAGPHWTWQTGFSAGEATDYVTSTDGTVLLDTLGGIESEAPHVARHDPARVLREAEAKRRRLERYMSATRAFEHGDRSLVGETIRTTLWVEVREDTAVWSDHPDYRPEWKP